MLHLALFPLKGLSWIGAAWNWLSHFLRRKTQAPNRRSLGIKLQLRRGDTLEVGYFSEKGWFANPEANGSIGQKVLEKCPAAVGCERLPVPSLPEKPELPMLPPPPAQNLLPAACGNDQQGHEASGASTRRASSLVRGLVFTGWI